MKHLAVCAFPGDEITTFGNAIVSGGEWAAVLVDPDPVDGASRCESIERWRRSCADLGIDCDARDYSEVFVPDIEDKRRRDATIAYAQRSDRIVMENTFGERVRTIGDEQFDRLASLLNKHYASRLRVGRISVHDLRATRHYRSIASADALRFAREFWSWDIVHVDPDNPWDLARSEYERDRYALELDVLRRLPWSTLTEVGACIGTFTERLADAFPGRRIRSYEPSEPLHRELARRVGDRVEVIRGGADDVSGRSDVLFVSSVLYYLDHFPRAILDVPQRWLVLSHLRSYHDETITPIMHDAGWSLASRDELPPRIERFCTFPVLKDGTEVVVWERR